MTELINHCKNNHKSQLFKCIIQYEYDSEESIEILAGENDMLFLIEKENLEKNDLEDFNNLFEQIEQLILKLTNFNIFYNLNFLL